MNGTRKQVRILKQNSQSLLESKDEEYVYWQGRKPLERLVTMQNLSFAFFEGRGNEAKVRQQLLRSPSCLPLL